MACKDIVQESQESQVVEVVEESLVVAVVEGLDTVSDNMSLNPGDSCPIPICDGKLVILPGNALGCPMCQFGFSPEEKAEIFQHFVDTKLHKRYE